MIKTRACLHHVMFRGMYNVKVVLFTCWEFMKYNVKSIIFVI